MQNCSTNKIPTDVPSDNKASRVRHRIKTRGHKKNYIPASDISVNMQLKWNVWGIKESMCGTNSQSIRQTGRCRKLLPRPKEKEWNLLLFFLSLILSSPVHPSVEHGWICGYRRKERKKAQHCYSYCNYSLYIYIYFFWHLCIHTFLKNKIS